jgi:hypothetical protein
MIYNSTNANCIYNMKVGECVMNAMIDTKMAKIFPMNKYFLSPFSCFQVEPSIKHHNPIVLKYPSNIMNTGVMNP